MQHYPTQPVGSRSGHAILDPVWGLSHVDALASECLQLFKKVDRTQAATRQCRYPYTLLWLRDIVPLYNKWLVWNAFDKWKEI